MAKIYPEKIDLFLVADAIRQELGSKITLMGAFTGGQIIVGPETVFPIHLPLGVVAAFRKGEGTFVNKLRIFGPDEKAVTPDLPIGSITKMSNQTMQVIVNFGMFTFPTPGEYRFEIQLDDLAFSEKVEVIISPTPIV